MEKEPFVVIQFPNKYLWVMIVAWIVGYFTKGPIHDFSQTIFYVAAVVWSYEEIVHGVNWFRKLLGILVMASVIAGIYMVINH